MKKLLSLLCLLVTAAAPAAAQAPRVLVAPVQCLPATGNGLATASIEPDVEGRETRLYFRRDGYGDFYWVDLVREEPGVHWGVFPVPEEANQITEYYVAVLEGGQVLAQSPVRTVAVDPDCDPGLDEEQRQRAANLAIGETSLSQKHRKVAWWECIGVTERIDIFGERREDHACRPIGWWDRPEMLVPFGLAGAGITTIVIIDEEPPPGGPELSPVIP